MPAQQENFLRIEFMQHIHSLTADSPSRWGKMNAWEMIEHLSDFFRVSTGQLVFPLAVPEEHLPKYREFIYSEKAFRENTKAPANVLGENPLPLRNSDFVSAVKVLQENLDDFFKFFEKDPSQQTMHPAFGMLNFEDWVRLHYKHVTHHLRQFGLLTAL
jgi:hypothetical protein